VRAGGLLPLEQKAHEVQRDSDLKRTCAAGQLEEFVPCFRQADRRSRLSTTFRISRHDDR
jgi:hypothetical protein